MQHRLRGDAEVQGILHGPVNALTDTPRLLHGDGTIGGAAAAACYMAATGPRYAARTHAHAVVVESALTDG